MEFNLKGKEYIELNNLLKYISWAESGGEAKSFIREGIVFVNQEQESRIRRKLRVGDTVTMNEESCVVVDE